MLSLNVLKTINLFTLNYLKNINFKTAELFVFVSKTATKRMITEL
jgi:hypothetical protein